MWFSTPYGLNRYDGYSFKVFTRDGKNTWSLPDNNIEEVIEGENGELWIKIMRWGYVCYDPEKEIFRPAGPLLEQRYGIGDSPTMMFFDSAKNVWSHAWNGTHCYNVAENKLLFYPFEEELRNREIGIASFAEDSKGVVILYSNGWIVHIDPATDTVSRQDYLATAAQSMDFSRIFVDGDGDYWVAANGGVWVYYTARDRWEFLSDRPDSPLVLSAGLVNDIKKDAQNRIWIAFDHGGINIIDKKLNTIRYIRNDIFDERSLRQNSVNCLYCDDSEGMWVGYYKRGISYYNESVFKFRMDPMSEFHSSKNIAPDVNAIVEDRRADLWLGTSNGLIFMDRKTGRRDIYQHIPGRNSLSGDVIVSMLEARDGRIWMGTFRNGLNVFNGRTFTNYRHDPQNGNSLVSDDVWALAEGADGYIWIGTLGKGLQGFDPRTGKFTLYSRPGSGFEHDYVTSLLVGRDGNIYMATTYGITVYSPATDSFERWLTNKTGTQSLQHPDLNSIYEDSRGLMWIATAEGLNVYDRRRDEITLPISDPVLGSGIVQAIVEDNDKNMWITTTTGISSIVVGTDYRTGRYTYTFHSYGKYDGLEGQQFNARAILKTHKGEIIAGGVSGLSFFQPEELKYNNITPKLVFTGLQLFGEEVKIDSIYGGNKILTRALGHADGIRLKFKQNVFSVSFSAMNYILPEKTKYSYILEGLNSNWIISDRGQVTFTELASGHYTLKVKAINSDGFTSNEISELEIVIDPPFLASPVAWIMYFLLAMAALFLARREILRNERHKFKLVQIEQEAQHQHEIDDMKLRFFTNVGHELRTPLTLIISPLESVIRQMDNDDQKGKLEMVRRNAMRLLLLVNQLLDFRKSDVKGHRLNVQQGDIVEFIRSICNSFGEYSERKNVHLTFFTAMEEVWMAFDEDKIGKVVMNLLANAFNFTPEGGRVDVALSVSAGDESGGPEQFEIKVSDTGVGIADEDKELIFERFYQVQPGGGQKSSGSGIGLHLAREFVSLHGGSVSVHDNIGRGSVFIVTIPAVQAGVRREPNADTAEKTVETPVAVPEGDLPEDRTGDNLASRPVILIVDDNDDFRLFMRDILCADYTVEEAADGVAAWSMIPELQPDMVVSDVMMPRMDGNELCRLVKTDIRTSHIPLILLTARSDKGQKLEGLESGADDYVTKPFDFDILALKIRNLLQMQRKRHENFTPLMEINPSEITITPLDEKLINKAVKYVEDNIAQPKLSVEELSAELGMSRVHLYKKMVSITGKTPSEFIRIVKLKRAAQFLRESQLNISEIAYMTGFNNPKFFRKYFKDEFGILPSEYQNKEKD